MKGPLRVPICAVCAHAIWPPRPLCPACGSMTFNESPVVAGSVEETTANVEHLIASVRSDAGPTIIARLQRSVPAGARVSLSTEAVEGGWRVWADEC